MNERVGSDQQGRLKDYAYDPNMYVNTHTLAMFTVILKHLIKKLLNNE